MADLEPRQQRFVDEYLIDLNGTEAAIRAGYSKNSAKVIASQLLAKPHVKAAVEARQAERSREAGDVADRAAARLEAISLMDLGDGPMRSVPTQLLAVVGKHTVDLLKLHGKFKDQVEHTGLVNVVISSDDAGLL